MTRSRLPPEVVSASRRKVSLARWHPELAESQQQNMPPDPSSPPPAPKQPLPTGRSATLADYDRLLGQPITWTDAKTREQVQKEILDNEAKQDENLVRRKKLFTAAVVEEREKNYDELVFSYLATLADFAASLVSADQKDAARKAARAFVSDARAAIAQEMKKRAAQ